MPAKASTAETIELLTVRPDHRRSFIDLVEAQGGDRAGTTLEPKPKLSVNDNTLRSVPENRAYTLPSASLHSDEGYRTGVPKPEDPIVVAAQMLATTPPEPVPDTPPQKKSRTPARKSTKITAPSYQVLPYLDYLNGYRVVMHTKGNGYNDNTKPPKRIIAQCAYMHVLHLEDMRSEDSLGKWIQDHTSPYNDDRSKVQCPQYIHGVFFEGIHFNRDRRDEALRLINLISDNREPPKTPRKSTAKTIKTVSPKFAPEAVEGAYFRLGRYLFSSLRNSDAWAEVHQVRSTASDDDLVRAWRTQLVSKLHKDLVLKQEEIENLQNQLAALSRDAGQMEVVYTAASSGTEQVIKDRLDALRNLGEIERVEPSRDGFRVFTGDMYLTAKDKPKPRFCGRFEIQVNLKGHIRMRNTHSPIEDYSAPKNCLGTFASLFINFYADFDYPNLILTCMEYFREVRIPALAYDKMPDSTRAPSKTYVSAWRNLLGDYENNVTNLDWIFEDSSGAIDLKGLGGSAPLNLERGVTEPEPETVILDDLDD